MKINTDTWYFKLYAKAFIEDRNWLDWSYAPLLKEELSETIEYKEALRIYSDKNPNERTEEEELKVQILHNISQKAKKDWFNNEIKRHTKEMSLKNLEKVKNGRMSLCPYFWSIVLALVVYCGIEFPLRKVSSFFKLLFSPLTKRADKIFTVMDKFIMAVMNIIVVLFIAGFISLVGYGIYEKRNEIQEIPFKFVETIKYEFESYKFRKKSEEEYKKQQERETLRKLEWKLEWEKEHPEEARKQKEEMLRQKKLDEEYAAREREIKRQEMWRTIKDIAFALLFLIGIIVSTIIFVLVISGIFELAVFLADSIKNKTFWMSIKGFKKDTYDLISAFLKAKKEKVCPFVHFEDNNNIFNAIEEKLNLKFKEE